LALAEQCHRLIAVADIVQGAGQEFDGSESIMVILYRQVILRAAINKLEQSMRQPAPGQCAQVFVVVSKALVK
jgi:hypothetical protein